MVKGAKMVSFSIFQVLSGCEWGNILVWEAGLVKLEVTQKGRKFCHKAPIVSTHIINIVACGFARGVVYC